jgi:asparagine synthase (glutamine-hydrolysing)
MARALQGGRGITCAYHLTRRLFDDAEIASLGLGRADLTTIDETLDDLDAVSLLEMTSYLRDQLLPDADNTSMSHSIELRVPLLDNQVIDTVLSLRPNVRVNGKQMLATAAGIGAAPAKRPFALPMQQWVDSSLRATVREALLDDALPFGDVLTPAFRQQLWRDVDARRVHWAKPWAITVLRTWPQANGFSW